MSSLIQDTEIESVVVDDDGEVVAVTEAETTVIAAAGEQGPAGAAGVSDHGALTGREASGHPANVITLQIPPGMAADDVQAAIEELLSLIQDHDHTTTGGLIPEAALDVANTPNDRFIMSYENGKLKWLSSTEYSPTLLTVGVGTINSGNLSSLLTKGDGNTLSVQEVLGVPGFDIQVKFSNVGTFNVIRLYMRYTGGHTCKVQLWNVSGGFWDDESSFNNQNGLIDIEINVNDAANYIDGNGDVFLRFYHPTTGVATHVFYLDACHLVDSVTGGGGITEHSGLQGRTTADCHPATAISFSATGGISATTVQSAIAELDSEKLDKTVLAGTSKITVAPAAPGTPAVGDIWIDTSA